MRSRILSHTLFIAAFVVAVGLLSPVGAKAACKARDLKGTWQTYFKILDTDAMGWAHCPITTSSRGKVTSGAKCRMKIAGDDIKLELGPQKRLRINADCRVRGGIRAGNCSFIIEDAWMLENKNRIAGTGSSSCFGPGGNRIYFVFTAVKG